MPIGGPEFNPYVMLEVHYNNPTIRAGMQLFSIELFNLLKLFSPDLIDWVDSSGIRLWYTSHLRQYDAGVMELGLEYSDKMAIPPGQNAFTLTGYCLPQCTAVVLRLKSINYYFTVMSFCPTECAQNWNHHFWFPAPYSPFGLQSSDSTFPGRC